MYFVHNMTTLVLTKLLSVKTCMVTTEHRLKYSDMKLIYENGFLSSHSLTFLISSVSEGDAARHFENDPTPLSLYKKIFKKSKYEVIVKETML